MSEYYDDSIYEEHHAPEAPENTGMPPIPPKAPKKKKGGKGAVALVLCCALVGGGCGVGGAFLGTKLAQGSKGETVYSDGVSTVMKGVRETSALKIQEIDSSKTLTAAEVYAANVNSTVGIVTSLVTTNFWGQQTTGAAAGSGFIFSDDGYILTNYHVVSGATSITVSTYDGLTPVVIGDSDKLNVGDEVVAIGNPLGELTFSETSGIISALDREVTISQGSTMDLIQTDCAINSGNSGGALFNMHGEVIGITNAKYSSSSSSSTASVDNIGFAIPMNHVYNIVKSIIENGYIEKPYIGVSVLTVSSETQKYGLPSGAAVQTITKDSPAEAAGLQVNDIITKANDTDITTSNDLVKLVRAANPGDELTLTVYRQGETLTVTVTVGRQVQSANEESQTVQQQSSRSSQGYGTFPFGWGFGGY